MIVRGVVFIFAVALKTKKFGSLIFVSAMSVER